MAHTRNITRVAGNYIFRIVAAFALAVLSANAQAQAVDCSDFPNATLDGNVNPNPPSNININTNCTVRNFPADNPLTTNFAFFTQPGQTDQRWLLIFDNVVHTGQMSCDAVHEHRIWLTNGSITNISENCQNYLIPVEKIDKQNPPGQTTAAIGVPFTWTLTSPVLFDPGTTVVIDDEGSLNDLHGITLWDDLNETGVDLTFLGYRAYWKGSGAPIAHTFSNVGGLLTFDNFPIVPAGEQFVIEIDVVLQDTATNAPGTQFINTARWDFGRLIDDVFYEPLPGEWGISPPLTIAAPELIVTKTGPATIGRTLNLGEWGDFGIDVHNTGLTDAWDATIVDELPSGPTGGMCDIAPEIVSAQVFQSDGTTAVPGKGPLVEGVDYTLDFTGTPRCELTLVLLSPAAVIGPDERLIINYRTRLDADSQDGAQLTNIVGATQWYNGDSTFPDRVVFNRRITNGTVGVADHEDAHTTTVELRGYFFEKTVANLTTGTNPTTIAAPGDTLRYTLRLQTTDGELLDFSFVDDLGVMNGIPVFVPGSLTLVPGSIPPGADTSLTDPNGGTNNAGLLNIRNLSLPLGSELSIQFDIVLDANLPNGTLVTNQADLVSGGITIADSDDPNVNGQADPNVPGDEDPTQIIIEGPPPAALLKATTQQTATIGEEFSYLVTIPSTAHTSPLYDVRILDNLAASAADLEFVSVAKVSGSGNWTPQNSGTATSLVIEDPANGIDIPAGEQAVIEITLRLSDTPTNVAGLTFTNAAAYTYNLVDDDSATERPGESGTSESMTVVEPELTLEKDGPVDMRQGAPGLFSLNVHNTGDSPAWNVTIDDVLPNQADGGTCDAPPSQFTAQLFEADGVTPAGAALVQGTDFTVAWNGAPSCTFTLQARTPAAAIGPDQRLIVTYETVLDADTQVGATLTNIAGATEWFSLDQADAAIAAFARTYTRFITDGTVGVLDHEDAHTITEFAPVLIFEKTVANVTSGADPASVAAPGDTLRYTLRVENTGDNPVSGFSIVDELDELNASPYFEAGTLNIVSAPGSVDSSNTNANGGAAGTGLLDVRDIDIGGLGSSVSIEFEVTLAAPIADGTIVLNQSDLFYSGNVLTVSDDPNVNGVADPNIVGDEDPTRILIEGAPPTALLKANTQGTATIGETFSYQVTVPSAPHTSPIYDVRILDDLATTGADLEFVSVAKVSGSGSWTPVNTGTATNLVIEDTTDGIDIPAGEQAVIEITVRLTDTTDNVAGVTFTNTATYTYNLTDGDAATERPGEPGSTEPMTIVEPELTLEKGGPVNMRIGFPETFTLNVHNTGDSPAWNVTIEDRLPNQADGGMCDAAPTQFSAQLYEADGVTTVGSALVENTDFTVAWTGDPTCSFVLQTQTPAAAIGSDQRLIITYQAELDADTQGDAVMTNVAGATEWFSLDQADAAIAAFARTYTRVITDGTVGVLDHEDALTVVEFTPVLIFEKTVANLTTGDDPTATATPGDTLRYTLRIENSSDSSVSDFSIVDELDELNASPYFAAGTLSIVSAPGSADTSNTDANGGAAGTGLLDVRGLSLAPQGDSVEIRFDITLVPVIANDTVVLNQSDLIYNGNTIAVSDDPNVNGAADPNVSGDEDPTQVLIQSAPDFLVEKVSAYLDGDPAVLLAGERLRYTITIQNIGTDNATGVEIVDLVPANTTYVAGSTTLNAAAVLDGAGGTAPLIDGMLVNAPQDTTPGVMNADVADNVATIVFDVLVNVDVPDGTVLSNQAFVTAADQGVADVPSDDPRTTVIDDPTQDVVGNAPLLFAPKSAELVPAGDQGTPGIVDPGDTLRYTITIYNNGNVPATGVVLTDQVPANVSYIADTVTLNGLPVGQPDNGVFPLAAGIPVSSSDLTPPLPGAGEGTLSPGESAVVQFDMLVSDVPAGTLITNQATVTTTELPDLLTDGDGDSSTGPEPTVVVVGDAQALTILKDVVVVGGGAALPGATLEYTVTVNNVASVDALNVAITDDLNPLAGLVTYVDQSATLNGLTSGVTVTNGIIRADYAAAYGALPPGETAVLRFRAVIDPALTAGTTITNTAEVAWNTPTQTETASVSIDVGAIPGTGTLSGSAWHDADHDDLPDGTEQPLQNWTVELLQNGQPIRSMLTDTDGDYVFTNVAPNAGTADLYSLRFIAPGAGATTALLGETESPFTNSLQRIDDIVVQSGGNVQALNLPLDPNGVVYDSVARTPVPGAIVELVDVRSGLPMPSSCFDDPNQQGQVTIAGGYYKFSLNFQDPTCTPGPNYLIRVTAPGTNYDPGVSAFIPPTSDQATPSFDVPSCPGTTNDAVIATAQHCEATPSEFAPPGTVPARSPGTVYHLFLRLDDTQVPGSSQLFNNHIPLDPRLGGAVSVTKTTPMLNVTRGQLVPYTITISNSFGVSLSDITVVDRFPAGFRYVEGSARFDGVETEPTMVGRELTWSNLQLTTDGRHEVKLLLAVGAGVSEGEFVNRAQAMSSLTGTALSEEAEATVRIVPDPTFDCTDVTGKVFDDANRNGYQDSGEVGLAGVRLVTARGLAATTDAHGRYHVTCAITPNEARGSNFVLKLDDRTLPSGFRASTRPVQIQRATRGKSLRVNFGASIHRVVGLDVADPVFEPDSTVMRHQWRGRIGILIEELTRSPAVLRLSYVADTEEESLVERRIDAMKELIMSAWEERDCCYKLVIEPEVFWRRGEPADKPRRARK